MKKDTNNYYGEYVDDIYYELAQKQISDNDGCNTPLLLKYMLTREEAEAACFFPCTIQELSQHLHISEVRAEEIACSVIEKGAAQINKETGMVYFVTAIVFLSDYGMATPRFDQERGEKYFDLMRYLRTTEEYLQGLGEDIKKEGETGAIFRILPKYDAIKNIPGVMPCENLKMILQEYDGKICAVRCICRTTIRNGSCDVDEHDSDEDGFCIKFGKLAEHYVENMKVGKYLSSEEAFNLLKKLDKKASYHMIGNAREVMGGFCNCCECCCDMRMGSATLESVTAGIAKSRFECKTTKENCVGCGKCQKLCTFDAISYDENKTVQIDLEKCMGCGSCVINCPSQALKLKLVRPVGHIPIGGKQHIYDSLQSG